MVEGSKHFLEHSVLGILHQIEDTEARIELWTYLNRVCWRSDAWAKTRSIVESVSGVEFTSYTADGLFWVEDDFCPLVFARLIERPASYYQQHVETEEEARALVKVEAKQCALDLQKHDKVRKRLRLQTLSDYSREEGFVLAKDISPTARTDAERAKKYRLKCRLKNQLKKHLYKDGPSADHILANLADLLGVASLDDVSTGQLLGICKLAEPASHLRDAIEYEVARRGVARQLQLQQLLRFYEEHQLRPPEELLWEVHLACREVVDASL